MVNTVTLYRSPVRLVLHTAEAAEPYASNAISRARKKMMAEISLAGDEISIDGVPYSRNDASTLLDLVTENSWRTHTIIYANKGLLNFLEKEEFNHEELRKADAYLYNHSFVQEISPYFAHSFNTVSGKLIRTDQFKELEQLLSYQGYITPEHSTEAYQKIRNYCDELIYTIRNLSWEKFIGDESILYFIFSDEWKKAINKLPSQFATVRDEIVEQMINLVLRFQHKATWYYLHQVLVNLKQIDANDFNRSELVRIDTIIYQNSQQEGKRTSTSKTGSGEVSGGRIIWWAIWIIISIIRIATCNSSSTSSPRFNYNDYKSSGTVSSQSVSAEDISERLNETRLINFLGNTVKYAASPETTVKINTGDQPFSSFADDPILAGNQMVMIHNKTDFDCVLLYFRNTSSSFSGYLPKVYAAYVKKGAKYHFKVDTNNGRFHLLFGNKWGELIPAQTLELSSFFTNENSLTKQVHVYNYFTGHMPSEQTYLQRTVEFHDADSYSPRSNYKLVNVSGKASKPRTTDLLIQQKGNGFTLMAKGKLSVIESIENKESAGVEEMIPPTNMEPIIIKNNKKSGK